LSKQEWKMVMPNLAEGDPSIAFGPWHRTIMALEESRRTGSQLSNETVG
jgi:hypothetical protein